MIATSWTNRAFVYVHAIARIRVPLVPKSTSYWFRGPITILALQYVNIELYELNEQFHDRGMKKYVAHETTSGHVCFVVARRDERSSRYCATSRGSFGSGGAGSGGERFANVGTFRI